MTHLPTKWAERKDKLYITLQVSGATDVDIKFTEKTISITGKGITPKSSEPHDLKDEITLLKEIVPEKSTFKVLGVAIQVCAEKKEEGYWNKLVDQPTSRTANWLSVDWNLWKDEDDEDEAPAGFGDYGDLSNMLNMGGMGGMPGMGGLGGMEGMEGMDDSDDEEEEGTAEAPAADLKDLDK
ncbi:Wos2 protein [Trypanosoma theileri]|uniref:Wos2 protein n=1 Tax=Trypanosoma theileri TaxID=67003 RepID=A0A1X0P6F3_9TRYP|nr:Wos2 protein [Trypanosoma theileri]ORC92010.1 Wos2 protein [Trypanosoma theileri]